MKQLIYAVLCLTMLGACTKDFEETNQDPNQISDELLKQDFNLVGSPFSGMVIGLSQKRKLSISSLLSAMARNDLRSTPSTRTTNTTFPFHSIARD